MTFRKKSITDVEGNTFPCKICSKIFSTRRSLHRHTKRTHGGNKFQCYYCSFTSKFKECIARHVPLHLVKKEVGKASGAYVKCPFCEFGCIPREIMIKHYIDEHDVEINEQNLEFPGMEEFFKWKYEIEQIDVCQYTSRSKKNRDAAQIRYYRCFRDGIFQKKGKGIRNMKLKGSLKINGVCPAGIKAEEDRTSGVVRVTVIRSHVGHSNELGLLNLSKIERAEIAHKLSMGMTHEDILGGIRGSIDANIKRVHLTTRKDVWNVESSFGLGKGKKKYVKDTKATKARKKDDVTNHGRRMLEGIPGSDDLIAETLETNVENVHSFSVPIKTGTALEQRQQELCFASVETSETHVWGVQCLTEPQELASFYSAQSVPEETNVTENSYDLDNAENIPVAQHEQAHIEPCDSSNDNDDHYFEIITPELPDGRPAPSENQLNEKKNRIRTKVEELLDTVNTEEQADMFYNELLRIQDSILSSFAGPF